MVELYSPVPSDTPRNSPVLSHILIMSHSAMGYMSVNEDTLYISSSYYRRHVEKIQQSVRYFPIAMLYKYPVIALQQFPMS